MIGDKDSKEFKGEAEILWTYKKDFNEYGCPLCQLKPPKSSHHLCLAFIK